jgi:hypothetical protein
MESKNKPAFSLIQEGELFFMEIAGRKIQIDLKNKMLPGFKVANEEKKFFHYEDLLHTAYATDKIVQNVLQYESEEGNEHPFYYTTQNNIYRSFVTFQ